VAFLPLEPLAFLLGLGRYCVKGENKFGEGANPNVEGKAQYDSQVLHRSMH